MDTRDVYIEKLKTELDSINAGLAMYEARLRKASASTQKRFQDEFDSLQKKRDDFSKTIDAVKRCGSIALEETKDGAEGVAKEFRRSLERARERM